MMALDPSCQKVPKVKIELLFRDIKLEDLYNEDMSVIKARLIDTGLTSYQNFSRD